MEAKEVKNNNYTIICFSDIHGNKEALKAILKEIEKIKPDEIIFLGDAVSKGPDSNECINLLKNEKITCLQGNNEYFILNGTDGFDKTRKEKEHLDWARSTLSEENIDYIKNWPIKYILKFKNKSMQFAHFLYGDSDKMVNLQYLYEKGINSTLLENNPHDYVFFGHKHIPGVELNTTRSFIAIGSSGCTRCEFTHYVLIKYNSGKIEVQRVKIPYDSKTFEERIKEIDYPNKIHYMNSLFYIN